MAKPHVTSTRTPRPSRLDGLAPRTAALLGDAARFADRNDIDGAERALTGALALAPSHPETLRLHGLVLHRRGRHAEAADAYRRALAAQPDDPVLLTQLGELAADRGDNDTSIATLRRAAACAPADTATSLRLGIQLDRQGLHEEALAAARRVVAAEPKNWLGHMLIARSLHALGDIAGAASQYRRMIALGDPRAYQAWFSLVDMKTVALDAKETAKLGELVRDPKLGDDARAPLNFAFGKVCEDAGRYGDAFAAFARANGIVRRTLAWNAAAFSREVDAIGRAFTATTARASESIGDEVIFVVGLPRSSTTLFEQILAAHPDVEGASELPDLPNVIAEESRRRGQPFPAWVADATPADWERLGRAYLARTARWRAARPRFTDKLPSNWPLIGAALAMLPGAKVIDCRRDAVETCWSCYKQLFAPGLANYAYDLGELASYWRDYDRLSRFWVARYPASVRAQGYEALLDDPEAEIRAMLEFAGLAFDARCLEFQNAARSVRTASAAQVRQPLRRGTARTAHYGERLAPLRAALEVRT
jgi:tetratricopeptide (TPR) repeat protein